MYTTTEEREGVYSEEAFELLQNSGYLSTSKLIHLMAYINMTCILLITTEDIKEVYNIYIIQPYYECVKMTKRTISHAVTDENITITVKK